MNNKAYPDLIRFPLVTEKVSTFLQPLGKYAFAVRPDATAPEIKKAIEKIYSVKVVSVNVLNCRGKKRRFRAKQGKSPDWKKALVTLKKGDQIEFA